MKDARKTASRLIRGVASPLRFFALALVVLGSIVIGLAWKSALPPEATSRLIYITLIVLVLLLILVVVLIVFFPKKLVFDQDAHLAVLREGLGDDELPTSYEPGTSRNMPAPSRVTDEEGNQ